MAREPLVPTVTVRSIPSVPGRRISKRVLVVSQGHSESDLALLYHVDGPGSTVA